MNIFGKYYHLSIAAICLCAALLSSCRPSETTEETTPSAAFESETPALHDADGEAERKKTNNTILQENYTVLRDATESLDYDPEEGYLFIYNWRIESFEFLEDFEGITTIEITDCYIPEGVTIPQTEALSNVRTVEISTVGGTRVDELLSECLPLPSLKMLSISSTESLAPLPTIESLTDLYVSVPNAMEFISNNTHITGSLQFGNFYSGINFHDYIGEFSNIQYLNLPQFISDISSLSGCTSLRILDMQGSKQIDTLEPLYNLPNLEEIIISEAAYNALPEADCGRFSPENNGDASLVHVYGFAYGADDLSYYENEGEYLKLEGEKIDSFDFLEAYPNLKYLSIVDCDIADGLVIPKIDTLERLEVFDQKVMEIIQNNTQLSGWLTIGTGYSLYSDDRRSNFIPLSNLDGIEKFTSLETLYVQDPVPDISALKYCVNLRYLSLFYVTEVETLSPLFGLNRFRSLTIDPYAFRALPEAEQAWFDNAKLYLPHVEWR